MVWGTVREAVVCILKFCILGFALAKFEELDLATADLHLRVADLELPKNVHSRYLRHRWHVKLGRISLVAYVSKSNYVVPFCWLCRVSEYLCTTYSEDECHTGERARPANRSRAWHSSEAPPNISTAEILPYSVVYFADRCNLQDRRDS